METEEFIKRIRALGPLGGHPRFYELLISMAETHSKKNHDYAKDTDPLSNLKLCESFGITAFKGILVRLGDKWSRITELSKKVNQVKDESIMDTLIDNANYSLLAIVVFEEQLRAERTSTVSQRPDAPTRSAPRTRKIQPRSRKR